MSHARYSILTSISRRLPKEAQKNEKTRTKQQRNEKNRKKVNDSLSVLHFVDLAPQLQTPAAPTSLSSSSIYSLAVALLSCAVSLKPLLQMLRIVLRQKVVVNQSALFSVMVFSQALLGQMEVAAH